MNAKKILDRIEKMTLIGNGVYRSKMIYRNESVIVICHQSAYDAYMTLRKGEEMCSNESAEMQNLWRMAAKAYKARPKKRMWWY